MKKDKERMEEFWVKIPGFPTYAVSNYGNVRNVRTNRDVRPVKRKSGYLSVNLYGFFGERKVFNIHHLVAQAFFENYKKAQHVYHINNVRHDNAVINLTLSKEQ